MINVNCCLDSSTDHCKRQLVLWHISTVFTIRASLTLQTNLYVEVSHVTLTHLLHRAWTRNASTFEHRPEWIAILWVTKIKWTLHPWCSCLLCKVIADLSCIKRFPCGTSTCSQLTTLRLCFTGCVHLNYIVLGCTTICDRIQRVNVPILSVNDYQIILLTNRSQLTHPAAADATEMSADKAAMP